MYLPKQLCRIRQCNWKQVPQATNDPAILREQLQELAFNTDNGIVAARDTWIAGVANKSMTLMDT